MRDGEAVLQRVHQDGVPCVNFGPRAAWGVVLGLCCGAVEVSELRWWLCEQSSGGMVFEVLGDWSTGMAAEETVADAGVSVPGASHGVVG